MELVMAIKKEKITFIYVVTFLAFFIVLSSGQSVFGDVLFIGETNHSGDMGTTSDDPVSSEDFTADTHFEDEEFEDKKSHVKVTNPVAVFSAAVKEILNKTGAVVSDAFRSITDAVALSDNQWPIALAGLLFLMLMMRFRKRARKTKF
jgi:hypothetical protein